MMKVFVLLMNEMNILISPQEVWQKQVLKPIFEKSFKENLPHSKLNLVFDDKEIKDYYNNKYHDWQKIWRYYNFLE